MAPDPATSTWLATVASRIAASLATKVLGASARRVQKAFADSEKQKAFAQCLAAGLETLIEQGYTGDVDEHRAHIDHVLTTFAAEEEAQDVFAELLAAVLASGATPPDPVPLREIFGDLHQPETLPDFDPDRGFAAFVEAFAAQARQQEALQETIRTERLDELVKLARDQVKAIEALPGRIVEEQEKAELRLREATQDAVRRRYLEHMRRRWRALPLAALGGTEGAGEEVTLDQVFIELDTTTPEVVPTVHLTAGNRWQNILSALDAASQDSHVVLLGDPGAGKSAFTQELLARIASAQLGEEVRLPEDLPLDLLPVFVRLRDLSRCIGGLEPEAPDQEARSRVLAQAVRDQVVQSLTEEDLEACTDLVREAWRTGKCFLVLDGLDEVPESRRALIREGVTAVRRQTGMERILVTCRVRSYQGEARLPEFEAHTLAPFDEMKIEAFCQAWYRAQFALGRVNAADADEKAGDLARAALGEDILPLACNPMLLTTMALIHQKEVGLPRERARLYDKGVEVLLTRWQQRKDKRLVEDEELATVLKDEPKLRRLLERLAFEAHKVGGTQQEEAAGLPRGSILTLLEREEYLGDASLAARFLDYVDQRAGILVGQGGEPGHPASYSFPHRTFQEYFAGCYVVGQRERERRYFELAGEGDLWSVAAPLGAEELFFVRRGTNDVMDLAYALAGKCEPYSEKEQRALLWAGQIAALVGTGSFERDRGLPDKEGFLGQLRQGLVALLGSDLSAPERVEAGSALGKLGDPRKKVLTCSEMEFCWVPEGSFVFGERGEEEEIEMSYSFWMGRYPVTAGQFHEFVADGGYADETLWVETETREVWTPLGVKRIDESEVRHAPRTFGEPFDLPNHPVVGVNWYGARAFARWLTRRWKEAGLIPQESEVVLPTDEQWVKAARGGRKIPPSPEIRAVSQGLSVEKRALSENTNPRRRYPWGEDLLDPHLANFAGTGIGTTSTPGCFPTGGSPVGCEEMIGNVWEWCSGLSSRMRQIIDAGEDWDSFSVAGGGFLESTTDIRIPVHTWVKPHEATRFVGLRVLIYPVSARH